MARILSDDVIDNIQELRAAMALSGQAGDFVTAKAAILKSNYSAAVTAATTLDQLKAVVLDLIDQLL